MLVAVQLPEKFSGCFKMHTKYAYSVVTEVLGRLH